MYSFPRVSRFLVWSEYMGSNVVSTPLSEMEGQEPDPASSIFDQSSKLRELKALAQNRNGSPLQGMETDPLFPSSESFQRALETSTSMQFLFRDKLPFRADPGSLTEWDLRAAMEKKRQMKREREQWLEENARNIGRYAPVASDWRTDVRITETGNLYHPEYREWTLEEIWDLITLGGKIVDPRQVPHEVSQLDARVDFVAEGFVQEPEIPEWLDQQGKLLKEEDEGDVLDKEAEEALLASEFSDFENFGSTDSYSDSIDEPFVDDF